MAGDNQIPPPQDMPKNLPKNILPHEEHTPKAESTTGANDSLEQKAAQRLDALLRKYKANAEKKAEQQQPVQLELQILEANGTLPTLRIS